MGRYSEICLPSDYLLKILDFSEKLAYNTSASPSLKLLRSNVNTNESTAPAAEGNDSNDDPDLCFFCGLYPYTDNPEHKVPFLSGYAACCEKCFLINARDERLANWLEGVSPDLNFLDLMDILGPKAWEKFATEMDTKTIYLTAIRFGDDDIGERGEIQRGGNLLSTENVDGWTFQFYDNNVLEVSPGGSNSPGPILVNYQPKPTTV
jgi:hypothetical protein